MAAEFRHSKFMKSLSRHKFVPQFSGSVVVLNSVKSNLVVCIINFVVTVCKKEAQCLLEGVQENCIANKCEMDSPGAEGL